MGGAKEYNWSLVMLVGIVGLVGVVAIMESFSSTERVSFLAQPSSGADALVGSAMLPPQVEPAVTESSAVESRGRRQDEEFARINGLRKLGEEEFAIITSNIAPSGINVTQSIVLSTGQRIEFTADENAQYTIVEGAQTPLGSVQYVDDGAMVLSYSSFDEPQRIDPAIKRKLKRHERVPVIVQFDLPEYYVPGQSAAHISEKSRRFESAKREINALIGGKAGKDLKIINGISATVDAHALEALERSPRVKRVEADREISVTLDTSLPEIGVPPVWSYADPQGHTLTGVGRRIAIIDSGVDYTHPDLGGCFGPGCKVTGGYDFINNDSDPMDDYGHGTHVAATAAGNGLLKGVAPDAKIYAYKVLAANGWGWNSDVIAALERSVDPNGDGNTADHVDVASLSLGGAGNPDSVDSLAVDQASAMGVVVTVAAGNSGSSPSTVLSPGVARSAITVAASCKTANVGSYYYCDDPIASFSSRGPVIWNGADMHKPDVAAPGVLICAARWGNSYNGWPTCFDNAHIRLPGTSMATPHVAGAAAIVKQAHPEYTPAQVKQLLKMTAKDLGMIYDAQGAGLLDLNAAIPSNQRFSIAPHPWTITTNPQSRYSVHSQTFTVAVPASNVTVVTLNAPSAPGISFALSKSRLNLSSGSDSVTVTVTIDNDAAVPGSYIRTITFSDAAGVQGGITAFINVAPTLEVTPSPVDFGVDDPALTSWSSARQVVIRNFRTDTSRTVSFSLSGYPAGVSLQYQPVTVPAGGSATADLTLHVSNGNVANGHYSGTVVLTTATGSTPIPSRFKKYHVLYITMAQEDFYNHAPFVFLHNQSTYWLFSLSNATQPIYVPQAGTYNAIVTFFTYNYTTELYSKSTVVKEGVAVNGFRSVPFSMAEAKYEVRHEALDMSGNALPLYLFQDRMIHPSSKLWYMHGGRGAMENRFSAFSSAYTFHVQYMQSQPAPVLYIVQDAFTGLNGNRTVRYSPPDYSATRIQVTSQKVGNIRPMVYSCMEDMCMGYYREDATVVPPLTQTVYSVLVGNYSFFHSTDNLREGCTSSAPCLSLFKSPYINPVTKRRGGLALLWPPYSGDTIYNGLGPFYWAARFDNSASGMALRFYFNSPDLVYRPALMGQDYSFPEYSAIPYTIHKSGTQVASGTIPAMSLSSASSTSPFASASLAAGTYEFRATASYVLSGTAFSGTVNQRFTIGASDPNPPAIKRMWFLANRMRTQVYDPAKTNTVAFELDPVGGTLGPVTVSYSLDGITFVQVPVVAYGSGFKADLPALAGTKIAVRIDAQDSAANTLSYAFEVPRGTTPVGPIVELPWESTTGMDLAVAVGGSGTVTGPGISCGSDCTESYASGTSVTLTATPASGYVFSGWSGACTGTGSCTVTMTADKAVTATFVPSGTSSYALTVSKSGSGTVTGPGISCGSDCTESYASGTSVTLTATPASGYVFNGWSGACSGTSSCTLSMTANKAVAAAFSTTIGDTAPPQVSITSPAPGSTLPQKGNVKIQASASDASGIHRIVLGIDGTTVKVCTDVASCRYIWNTGSATYGQHTISARAYDNAGLQAMTSIIVTK